MGLLNRFRRGNGNEQPQNPPGVDVRVEEIRGETKEYTEKVYEITVEFSDGGTRTYTTDEYKFTNDRLEMYKQDYKNMRLPSMHYKRFPDMHVGGVLLDNVKDYSIDSSDVNITVAVNVLYVNGEREGVEEVVSVDVERQ